MKEIPGGITAPKGFLASGVYAGIKRNKKLDLALIYSERDAVMVGAFTTSKVKAAPVILTQRQVRRGIARAVIVNSGNANACTGKPGMEDAIEMAEMTARALSINKNLVCVASTGVIGEPLPMERIRPAIKMASEGISADGGKDAAAAIMTTDTFPKEVAVRGKIGGEMVTIGGIAKGSGMIYPRMATMLAFIATDAVIDRESLNKIFSKAVGGSFNKITVDGDTSTNDMVLCMANGMAGNCRLDEKGLVQFQGMLEHVCGRLSKMIVKDGEGATRLVEIRVRGAKNSMDAEKVAFAAANSNLVKTALFAGDPNWGRRMAAIGYSGAHVREDRIIISFNKVVMVRNGTGMGKEVERKVAEVMSNKEYSITIDLNVGNAETSVWTSDLSYDYVKINVAYRS
ncbi:MAG: bifunctional glutamate N-acetyltransferase/amino-acid acetyltransferase ArgJ [Nitrospirae bacterium]|nr:bifunctional glutamate N-acetyltransferase/amino-acid acetyltransferase ArgJ [Nitrospirota bacterium]